MSETPLGCGVEGKAEGFGRDVGDGSADWGGWLDGGWAGREGGWVVLGGEGRARTVVWLPTFQHAVVARGDAVAGRVDGSNAVRLLRLRARQLRG